MPIEKSRGWVSQRPQGDTATLLLDDTAIWRHFYVT